jgi:hypothetical protein
VRSNEPPQLNLNSSGGKPAISFDSSDADDSHPHVSRSRKTYARTTLWANSWRKAKNSTKTPYYRPAIAADGRLNIRLPFVSVWSTVMLRHGLVLTRFLNTGIRAGVIGGLLLGTQLGGAASPASSAAAPGELKFAKTTYGDRETVMPVQVYLLLGGLFGSDGYFTSAGMFQLARMLRGLRDTTVTTYTWNRWPEAYREILAHEGKAKIVVIGYSGGGSRSTWLANAPSRPRIDLMISYDPSPKWQMEPIGTNVKEALCYHNTEPGMGGLGGGRLVGRNGVSIDTVNVAEQHMLVQVDQSLHRRTVEAVRGLTGERPARSLVVRLPTFKKSDIRSFMPRP